MRKITFAAVVVFLGLVGATYWTLQRENNRGIAYVTLSDVAIDQVDRIEITGPLPNVLEKKGERWYLNSNGRLADGMQVRNLLKSMEHIQSADLLARDRGRFAEYTVDDANGTGVRLMGGGHELANITAGRPMMGGMAIRKGDGAYKVNAMFPNAFAHNSNEWMERRLFLDTKNDDVMRIEVALRDEPPYAMVRKDQGWELAPGPRGRPETDFRLDGQAATRMLQELVNVRADVLLDQDPGPGVTGLAKNVDRLTVELKPKNPEDAPVRQTLVLGTIGEGKSTYAQVEGTKDVAVLPGYTAIALRKGRESVRDMRLNPAVDAAKVTSLEIKRGAQRLVLGHKDGQWTLLAGGPKGRAGAAAAAAIDQGLVQRRVADVLHARASSLASGVTPLQAGISPREGEARLTLEDKSTVTLAFGRAVKGDVYVRGAADRRVYQVNAALRDHILGMLDTFKKKAEGDPLARFDQEGIGNLPPDVRAGLSEHFAQKKREQQAQQLLKGRIR